jgi:large subunit ribosomal protein L22
MQAALSNYRQSPRKVRLLADLIRGRKASEALSQLSLLPKCASGPVSKLITSALANAKALVPAGELERLVIKDITVDGGQTLKRFRPRARGRANQILKRTSHIKVLLAVKK